MSLYEINLQREILREKSAEILADFHRYMEEKNIEQFDLNTPIGILHKVVGGIYRNIFKSEYETREKIDEANGKLDLAKEILKNSYLTPIGILHKVVGGIYRNIFKSEYETREKIDEANGKLDLAKEILKNSYLQKENYIKFKEFYEEYTKLSFLDFEELISNAKDEKEKLFFNMLLQYFMENNFNKVLREEKY